MKQTQKADSVFGPTIGNNENLFWLNMLKSSYTAGISVKQINKLIPSIGKRCHISKGGAEHITTTFGKTLYNDVLQKVQTGLAQELIFLFWCYNWRHSILFNNRSYRDVYYDENVWYFGYYCSFKYLRFKNLTGKLLFATLWNS